MSDPRYEAVHERSRLRYRAATTVDEFGQIQRESMAEMDAVNRQIVAEIQSEVDARFRRWLGRYWWRLWAFWPIVTFVAWALR